MSYSCKNGWAQLIKVLVSDSGQVKNTIDAVVRDFEKIDVFVANAGKWFENSFSKEGSANQFNRDVNFKANIGTDARRVSHASFCER